MDNKIDNCPVTFALSMLNGKWKLPIIWEISQAETIRFNELQRRLNGISNLMLSKSLQELELNKIINRHQYNEIPPRVEYSLTYLGKSLIPALQLLGEWGKRYYTDIIKKVE
jgi:DNA-binding HxlR family transcriptional regulator